MVQPIINNCITVKQIINNCVTIQPIISNCYSTGNYQQLYYDTADYQQLYYYTATCISTIKRKWYNTNDYTMFSYFSLKLAATLKFLSNKILIFASWVQKRRIQNHLRHWDEFYDCFIFVMYWIFTSIHYQNGTLLYHTQICCFRGWMELE